ncbi:hypothetical protein SNE40_005554 [Patella caerulea]|uniref:Corazonin n=1 Tax=Patella caerulea TaxID=87958 RepID=A0AAN8Q4U0_PATCE
MNYLVRCYGIALAIILLSDLALSQHYHFSNGWNSGKKRSNSVINPCEMRPDLMKFINTIIMEELNRIKSSCFNSQSDLDTDTDFDQNFKMSADRKWKR